MTQIKAPSSENADGARLQFELWKPLYLLSSSPSLSDPSSASTSYMSSSSKVRL